MEYKKGVRVKHPTMPAWGLGEVLEDSWGDIVRVFFVGAGEKKLSLKGFELDQICDDNASHPILDNLKLTQDATLRYRTLPECVQQFLTDYPGGFAGEKFAINERDYKLKAHRETVVLLGRDVFADLLAKGEYEEVCNRAVRQASSTNLIHLHEKLALRNGLQSGDIRKRFAEVLYHYLFGDVSFEARFNDFSALLEAILAGKWTILSFFSFIMFPDQHMFIKPTITNNAADICGFDIRYRPDLNLATYAAVLKFSNFLKESLIDLQPRDMIDVQSFMWCIRPDKSQNKRSKVKLS